MEKNSYGGAFIAFDGPNGVGKSTLIMLKENWKTILLMSSLLMNPPIRH